MFRIEKKGKKSIGPATAGKLRHHPPRSVGSPFRPRRNYCSGPMHYIVGPPFASHPSWALGLGLRSYSHVQRACARPDNFQHTPSPCAWSSIGSQYPFPFPFHSRWRRRSAPHPRPSPPRRRRLSVRPRAACACACAASRPCAAPAPPRAAAAVGAQSWRARRRFAASAASTTTEEEEEGAGAEVMIPPDNRIPATIITGFLGSGKVRLKNNNN